jgi:hypothetical protein
MCDYDYYACRIRCPCGGTYTRSNLVAHKHTKRHIRWVDEPITTLIEYNNAKTALRLRYLPFLS